MAATGFESEWPADALVLEEVDAEPIDSRPEPELIVASVDPLLADLDLLVPDEDTADREGQSPRRDARR